MMMPSIFREDLFDNFMEDFAFPAFRSFSDMDRTLYGKRARNLMKTDVKETEEGYEVDIDLPGFKKEDIQAELKDGYLTIAAVHQENRDEKDKEGKILRQERYSGSCKRSFYVGDQLKQEDVKAAFENGLLKLQFPKEAPKAVEEVPRYIPIEG